MNSTLSIAYFGILFLEACSSVLADDEPKVIYAEKFSVPLESGWSWLREESKGWKVEEGGLQILTLPGHVFAKYNDARNVLLRKAPETSRAFAVEVFVESQPMVMFEEATLYLYFDDDHYIGLFKERLGKEVHVRMIREQEGKAGFLFEKKYEAEGVWFRLVIGEGNAAGFYRQTEKESWEKMGQAELPAKGEAKIGLNASGGPKDTDRWARFRDFRILEIAAAK